MAIFQASVAAATAIVGYDLIRDEPWNVADVDRVITGMALLGSAAAGDTIADAMVGTQRIARLYNRTTGFPNMDDMVPLDAFVPRGAKISVPVVDAPATSPINVYLMIEDLE